MMKYRLYLMDIYPSNYIGNKKDETQEVSIFYIFRLNKIVYDPRSIFLHSLGEVRFVG